MNTTGKISYVIPCYRSHDTIQGVVAGIEAICGEHGLDYEIILVNDCSPDNTFDTIRSLCSASKKITGISLSRNFGQHSALMAGLNEASGDIVICMDDDGQTPPSESIKLIDMIREGFDVVFAKYEQKRHNMFRNLGSKLNDFMAHKMINKPKDLYLSSYVAIRKYIVDEIIRYSNPYPYLSGLLLRSTKRIGNVAVEHRERTAGKSGYTLTKLISLWMNGFTNFSVKPLRVSAVIGFVLAIAGFIAGIYAVINKLVNPNVPMGWTSTIAALLFVGGTILFVLGMVGEYVGRIYMSINQQPQFIVREKIRPGDHEQ